MSLPDDRPRGPARSCGHPPRVRGARRALLAASIALLGLACLAGPAHAERLKDLADVAGVRDNPLLGYGLVVGLDGTGDSTSSVGFTEQSLRSMLQQYGVAIPPGQRLTPKNVAAVTVSASLGAFAKPGQRLDVTVSSLGNAKSLRGGTLLMSPLRGADGQTYALAQGSLAVGGLGVEGADGSQVTINVPSVGRIPGGASVERVVPSGFSEGEHVVFDLRRPDFTTARRLVEALNDALGGEEARALDAASVAVRAPTDASARVAFVGFLETLEIEPGEVEGRVIVNARTGTIVIGANVTVGPAAVTHGGLTVVIDENVTVSQPAPLSGGDTVVAPDSDIGVAAGGDGRMFELERATTLSSIVAAINDVGAAPGDLVAILEALSQAGALRAELIVI